MKILLTGASGFVATTLIPKLAAAGHDVYGLVHKNRSTSSYVTNIKLDDLNRHTFDAVINLAGANIGAKRWTPRRKKELIDSRVAFTRHLKSALQEIPPIWLNASAVGYYGFDSEQRFCEDTPPNDGFTHELCAMWEQEVLTAMAARTVIFRLGVVLGNGGVLDKMKLPYKMGLGSKIGDGEQFFPWIHIEDVCHFIEHALKDERYQGSINLVSPEIVTQEQFSRALAKSYNRPHLLKTPAFALELAFGEMGGLVTKGQHVLPKALSDLEFEFRYSKLSDALNSLS